MTNEADRAKLRNWFFQKLDTEQRVSFISICLPLDESLARNLSTEMMFRVFDDICARLDIVHPTLPMPEGFIDPPAPDATEQLQAALNRPVAGGKDRCWALQQEARDHRNNCPVCQRAIDENANLEPPPATLSDYLDSLAPLEDETGWLIEEAGSEGLHWIALVDDIWVNGWWMGPGSPSPVERVRDANKALRFAREDDAQAFCRLFKRYLVNPITTEHCWPASADTHPKDGDVKQAPLVSGAVAKPDAQTEQS